MKNIVGSSAIRSCYLSEEMGCLFIAEAKIPFADKNYALSLFRDSYFRKYRPSANEDRLNRLCIQHSAEMECFNTDEKRNYKEYQEAINIWQAQLPTWFLYAYDVDGYLSHESYRDIDREGVYESLTNFRGSAIYWYHG